MGMGVKKMNCPLLKRIAKIRVNLKGAIGNGNATAQLLLSWSNNTRFDTAKAYDFYRPKTRRISYMKDI